MVLSLGCVTFRWNNSWNKSVKRQYISETASQMIIPDHDRCGAPLLVFAELLICLFPSKPGGNEKERESNFTRVKRLLQPFTINDFVVTWSVTVQHLKWVSAIILASPARCIPIIRHPLYRHLWEILKTELNFELDELLESSTEVSNLQIVCNNFPLRLPIYNFRGIFNK